MSQNGPAGRFFVWIGNCVQLSLFVGDQCKDVAGVLMSRAQKSNTVTVEMLDENTAEMTNKAIATLSRPPSRSLTRPSNAGFGNECSAHLDDNALSRDTVFMYIISRSMPHVHLRQRRADGRPLTTTNPHGRCKNERIRSDHASKNLLREIVAPDKLTTKQWARRNRNRCRSISTSPSSGRRTLPRRWTCTTTGL